MTELAVLFHRLGPYHRARLSPLADRCDLRVIEFSTVDNTYAWNTVHARTQYPITSLFTDSDIDGKPMAEVCRRLQPLLDDQAPRVVAIPGWSSPAALLALRWCRRTGTPAVLMSDSTTHDEPRVWWKEWAKSRIVRLYSAALVAGAPHVNYVAALGMARNRIFQGYDVVDNDHYARRADHARATAASLRLQLGLPENYFLASNRFIEKKNLHRLIEGYAKHVEHTGAAAWSLVLLGDGPLKQRIADQIEELGLSSRILLPGFKQYDELPIYYGLARAFVHASTSEQWGLVVNEAMASGLPVLVSSRCGCAPDLVKDGVNGFTFDPYDTDEMSRRMARISDGTCDLGAMGQASREIIREWSPDRFARNMMRAAQTAIDAPRPKIGWLDRILLSLLVRR